MFVEHGDADHSKRLGKAGLPRRRRFKVLECHPDRGYVRIDPDGLNVIDKVSLHRLMRAPDVYTIKDTSTPITKLQRRGNAELPLPPGWKAILKHGQTKDYYIYAGPGGKGTASSPLQAWREFNGDPVYMPQPTVPAAGPSLPEATKVPLLPSLYRKVQPQELQTGRLLTEATPPKITDRSQVVEENGAGAHVDGQSVQSHRSLQHTHKDAQPELELTTAQTDELLNKLDGIMRTQQSAQHQLHGWTISLRPRGGPSGSRDRLDLQVVSPTGVKFRSRHQVLKYLGRTVLPAAKTQVSAKPAQELKLGQRVLVRWEKPTKYCKGTVREVGPDEDSGRTVHRIRYDDGYTFWHDMTALKCFWPMLCGVWMRFRAIFPV